MIIKVITVFGSTDDLEVKDGHVHSFVLFIDYSREGSLKSLKKKDLNVFLCSKMYSNGL